MSDATAVRLDPIARAVDDIRAGKSVVVVDDEERENEGDLVFAASKATVGLLAFTIRWTSGVICVPVEGEVLDRLAVPLMTPHNRERMRTAYTISVDARDGVTTGISAADRTRTVRVLVDSATEPYDLVQPGHVFPLRYRPGGVLMRPGHTEASVDLARLAGLTPAGVIAEIVNDDGSMKRGQDLRDFADTHGLAMVSIADLIVHRRRHERLVERVAVTRLPTEFGEFTAYGFRSTVDGVEHVALVLGDVSGDGPSAGARGVLTRLHSECLTGDVLGSRRCDCGPQLQASMSAITAAGSGVVVYLRGHEGRGIGLLHKLRAYALQDGGRDTVDANLDLGLPADGRDYGTGAQILADLGVRAVRLLSNNPAKAEGLERHGITVLARERLDVAPTAENLRYLRTKAERMGHDLSHLLPVEP
ncbi:MAG: bifunctional 3,4-dihydroxy-2-butanone-4-phosphate synthase/GTP cyclohydrolase II [Actinomycetota bacterium]|nr:bifunctional 3,4-dihydroxy-2-butanone-4-phosphate synthase/GTP cyclohydrolase II [Actinomycetota bacterium]